MSRSVVVPSLLVLVFVACGSGNNAMEGENVYRQASPAGNSFACATCHALDEPASDGFTRPGHPISDATRRPSYKNGEIGTFLEAANTCRADWMGAPTWSEGDDEYLALFEFLDAQSTADTAPALSFTIGSPPTSVAGGDMETGRDVFNGRCAVCHGEDAVGTMQGPPLVGELLSGDLIAQRVRTSGRASNPIYPGLTGGIMPFWAEDRLSATQLLDVVAFVLANDPRGGAGGGGSGELRDCDTTHAKIGQTAMLSTFAHQVGGTATIVDDCTIEITNFNFDGQGIDVRFYSGLGGNYRDGFSLSEDDIRRNPGYSGETVYAQLPEGRDLDELDGISVWCVPAGVSFGDGEFL